MELREYWRVIQKNLWIVVVIPVIATLVTMFYSYKVSKPTYESTATVLTSATGQQSASLGVTLPAILTSQMFDQAVVQQFPTLFLTPSEIATLVQAKADGSLVYITATGPNEQFAATLANCVAETIVEQGNTFSLPSARLINPANANTPPIIASSTKKIVMSGVIGLILGLSIAFMREYLDLRIKTQSDLSRFLNIPVLGTVSEYKNKPKKTKRAAKTKTG